MPTLADYLRLAPFSVDELVDAANSVLRERPELHVVRRTVRYYVGQGVLRPPSGSPKYARYGADHLVRLVATRVMGDAGRSLDAVRRELERMPDSPEAAASEIQSLIEPPVFEESRTPPSEPGLVRRTPVGRIVIEAPAELTPEEIARDLTDALRRFGRNAG